MLDIIIPVLNEEKYLKDNYEYFKELSLKNNLIFVDGGSSDETVALSKELGEAVHSQKGRSAQKNEGAKLSKSEYLFFTHVDSMINSSSADRIEQCLLDGNESGCCTLIINDKRVIFRLFENCVNFFAKYFNLIDGDMGQFVKKDVFNEVGGFDNVQIMEDIIFGKKMLKRGKFVFLSEQIKVSARKWDDVGFIKLFCRYTWTYIKYFLGFIKPVN